MSDDSKSKRARLTEIVSGLGPEATPEQIREEAYRVGFGKVNNGMLIFVRNTLWPERKKRGGGFTSEMRKKSDFVPYQTRSAVLCPECGSDHVVTRGFYRRRDGSNTILRYRSCKTCGHKFSIVEPDVDPGRPASAYASSLARAAALKEKKCTYCKRVLPIDSFSLRVGSDVYRRPGCKECAADNRSSPKYLDRDLRKKYGITLDEYTSMLRQQGGRCALCGADSPFGLLDKKRKRKRRTFSVDHCHSTGKVRGLLCARCNLAIGNFGDDTELMRTAINYIELHRQQGVPSATLEHREH